MRFNPYPRPPRLAPHPGLFLLAGAMACLLALLTPLHAQTTPEVTAEVSILLHRYTPPINLASGDEMPREYRSRSREYYYWTPEGYRPLELVSNKISPTIHYRGPRGFILYERIPAATAEEEDTYAPRLGCRLPAGQGTYFLLGQDSLGNQPAALYPLPVDLSHLPRGSVYGFNLGSRPLQVATQNQRLTLKPREGNLINVMGEKPKQFQVMAAIDEDDKFKLVYRRHWPIRDQSRALCVFYPTNKAMTRWNSLLIPISSP